jgi:adenosylcobinamide kinase/adenosylcobinamide-phosphate guanylyltransferase
MGVVDRLEASGERDLILVSGPSRSGKSRWAEHLLGHHPAVTYVATSDPRPEDASWQERLRLHRQRRPEAWQLLECGPALASGLKTVGLDRALLVDSLGGFVAWHLELAESQWHATVQDLLTALQTRKPPVVLVIEETGWGLVPPTAIGGLFRDRLGALAQHLEGLASRSWLVVQGRAIDLHQVGHRVP